jgi:hypothetical protein
MIENHDQELARYVSEGSLALDSYKEYIELFARSLRETMSSKEGVAYLLEYCGFEVNKDDVNLLPRDPLEGGAVGNPPGKGAVSVPGQVFGLMMRRETTRIMCRNHRWRIGISRWRIGIIYRRITSPIGRKRLSTRRLRTLYPSYRR